MSEWFARWPETAPGLRRRSEGTITATWKMAQPFVRSFGRRRLDSLTTEECARWATRHRAQVRFVKTIMADAVLAKVLEVSPMEGVKGKRPGSRGEYVPTRVEVDALLAAVTDEWFARLALVAVDSGMRLKELSELEVSDVSSGPLDGTLIARVRIGKTGPDGRARPRNVIVRGPGAVALAASVLGQRGARLALPRWTGEAWTRKAASVRFVQARTVVGLPEACTFHSLRKAHATALLDAGKSDLDVAVQLGHFDAQGRPDAELVRRIYGRPDHAAALARIAAA